MEYDIEKEKIQLERNGKIIECDVLFTFDSQDTMKSYIGYTDHSIAANGRKNIFVSAYDPLKETKKLENITDERELHMIHSVLQRFDEEVNNY